MTDAAKVRVALMVPVNNTTMAKELPVWMPEGTTCEVVKIPRPPGLLTKEDIPAYVESAMKLAAPYAEDKVDVVVYGCTAAGILAGPVQDAAIGRELAERTGSPAVTTATSTARWLAEQGLKRIALLTPYAEDVNRRLVDFLAEFGVGVEVRETLGAKNTEELGRITRDQVAKAARALMNDRCDGLFISCSQLPTAGLVEELAEEFGRPVGSSIHATAHFASQAIGASARSAR
jgi:maleate cis-trans isomerase